MIKPTGACQDIAALRRAARHARRVAVSTHVFHSGNSRPLDPESRRRGRPRLHWVSMVRARDLTIAARMRGGALRQEKAARQTLGQGMFHCQEWIEEVLRISAFGPAGASGQISTPPLASVHCCACAHARDLQPMCRLGTVPDLA
eukprot:3271615-Pyramimonas_sp.AAC.1